MNAPATKPLTTMQSLNVRARRAMLIAGLGMVAAVGGAVLTGDLYARLGPKLIGGPLLVQVLVDTVLRKLWVLAVLPGIGYSVGRAIRVRPVSFAFGAALTGELFYVLLDYVTAGFEHFTLHPGALALRIGPLAAGILLTMRAVRAGTRAADQAQEKATRTAQAKKAEYAEMMAAAERTAERHEAKRSEGVAPAGESASEPAAPEAKTEPKSSSGA